MKKTLLALLVLLFAFFVALFSPFGRAFINEGGTCLCYDCADCSDALQDVGCDYVKLTQNIELESINNYCIVVDGKTFDCQNYKIKINYAPSGYEAIKLGTIENSKVRNCILENKGIVIAGRNSTIENSIFLNSAILASSGYLRNITLRNLEIENGFIFARGNNITIENVKIKETNSFAAIQLKYVDGVILKKVLINLSEEKEGINIKGKEDAICNPAKNILIKDTSIITKGTGINFTGCTIHLGISLENVSIFCSKICSYFYYLSPTILNSRFLGGDYGIKCEVCQATLQNNIACSNSEDISVTPYPSLSSNNTCDTTNIPGGCEKNCGTIGNTEPSVFLNLPEDNAIINTTLIDFNFTTIDAESSLLSCSLYIDGNLYAKNDSVINGSLTNFKITLSTVSTASAASTTGNAIFPMMGKTIELLKKSFWNFFWILKFFKKEKKRFVPLSTHYWYVSCNDGSLSRQSEIRYFTLGTGQADSTPPSITFIEPTPESGETINLNYVIINTSVTDNIEVFSCSLEWQEKSETMEKIGSGNSVNCYKVKTDLEDGYYVYKVKARDSNNNEKISETRSITIDTEKPSIEMLFPENNGSYSNSNLNLIFRVIDNIDSNLKCLYSLDGNEESIYATNSSDTVVELQPLSAGQHFLEVKCYDNANNEGKSETIFYVESSYIDNIKPSLSLTLSSPQTYINKAIMVNCEARDASGIKSLAITASDGKLICSTTSSNCSSVYKPESIGDKIISCTAYDNALNSNKVETTLKVFRKEGGEAEISYEEEESLTPIMPKICDITASLEKEGKGTCYDLKTNDKIYFELEVGYFIPLGEINDTGVELLAGVSQKKYLLSLNTSKLIDLDDDGIEDIEIILDNLKEDRATITITLLKRGLFFKGKFSFKVFFWFFLLPLMLAASLLTFFFYRKKRKKKKERKERELEEGKEADYSEKYSEKGESLLKPSSSPHQYLSDLHSSSSSPFY